ncbi:MAG: AI-2E family transporter [Wenzhouxiangella sp.]|jgi:predicted PurR-regulated permease PerM|nr:AI-2E family transporter [Wenzhouxiangella sp.]
MLDANPRLLNAALWLVVLFVTFYVLVIARDLLIPLVLAVFIWYLINLMARLLDRIHVGGWHLPRLLQFLLAGGIMVMAVWFFARMLTSNVNQVIEAAPAYQANINRLISDTFSRFGVAEPPALTALLQRINIGSFLGGMAAALGGLLGNIGLILIYLVFLFLEQRFFPSKLNAIFPDRTQRDKVVAMLEDVDRDVATYIGIKTLVSAMTGLISWVVLTLIDLDFAGFWAILIFVLNFIPNIGSLVATLLPALLALLQFDTLTPFFIVAIGVGATQIFVGSFLEPNLMSRSLNISPLIVLLSLVLWGSLWGISGMFLCVPITVVLMIILYHFDSARWIAVALSKDGQVTPSREA